MLKFGYILNKDGTVYKPPVMKEYKEFIESLRKNTRCGGPLSYKCLYCNICPSGDHYEWPPHKKNLVIQQNILEEQYFKMHNPEGTSLMDLEMEVWNDPEEDEYEVETKRIIYSFDICSDPLCLGIISFDLHLPAIYSNLFDMFYNPADTTMEDLKYVKTVLHYRTNLDEKYTLLPIEQYDGYHMLCCKEPIDIEHGPEYMFVVNMDMGDAKFRMADCFMENEHFRFPKEATKFYVAVTMERRI